MNARDKIAVTEFVNHKSSTLKNKYPAGIPFHKSGAIFVVNN